MWGRLALGLLLTFLTSVAARAEETKRVLVVHSFGSTAPPFTTISTAFEATLTRELGTRVDLDEVSLDMARFAQPDMEAPFAEFLRRRVEKWPPDLVVPVAGPAGRFVAKYRERLFPGTPVVYTGMDRRTLPPGALEKNASFVGEEIDLAGLVEDILQLAPDTTDIAVILGTSPLERYWAQAFRRAFEPFRTRVRLTSLSDLPFDQMLERVSALPPRSFILLGLLIRDAAGVTHNEEEALKRLHAVANAPIYGLHENQLGLGIVGGRLYSAEAAGVAAARIAIRILGGAPAASFPPLIIGRQGPRYDSRELRRWNIREHRLPPGSVIAFRQPTLWERYRWWIVGIPSIALVEAGLIVLLVVNLARKRRAERQLRESEERVNLAADSAGSGLWSLDLDARRIWTTPRLRELFQLPPATELDAASFFDAIHPEDREEARRSLERAVPEGPPLNLEFRVVRRDGSQRWIASRGHLDASGRRWSGASVDVTERKLAEEQLRESESRFRTVADSAPVLIWMTGVDTLCTFFNKPWLDFTGRTLAQEMGHGWREGVHPDDLSGCLKRYAEAFEARRPFVLQYRLRRYDGEYRWIADHGVPRYDVKGTFAGYIGSCSDITDRLWAEDKFRQVFEAAPYGMIMVDTGGRIALANRQAETIFGYPRGELIGLSVETLIPERLRHDHPKHRDEFVADPRQRPMGAGGDLFGSRKDGSEVSVEIGLNPVPTVEGLFVVASVLDITERRKTETETHDLRQELTHMSRVATMGEMTAAIIHELGQPLAAILTNAQAGMRVMASSHPDADAIRDILADIVADDRRAGEVIQHLRSLFRKGEVERQPLPLNDLIRDVITVVVGDARRRHVSINLDLAAPSLSVLADRVQLQQVLLNLMVNAFEAMVDVHDRPRRVILRTRALDDARVQVDVADTGPGIPPGILDSILKPFVTSKAGGMGMGLSVSDSIVRAHGGRLWAENAPEGGAVFHMVLPVMARAEEIAATAAPW